MLPLTSLTNLGTNAGSFPVEGSRPSARKDGLQDQHFMTRMGPIRYRKRRHWKGLADLHKINQTMNAPCQQYDVDHLLWEEGTCLFFHGTLFRGRPDGKAERNFVH